MILGTPKYQNWDTLLGEKESEKEKKNTIKGIFCSFHPNIPDNPSCPW